MLTGQDLGHAIEEARKLKNVSKKDMAAHFGVKPPSIQDWVRRGTIDKAKLQDLWAYFSDVVGPAHWGLSPQVDGSKALSIAAPAPPAFPDAFAVVLDGLAQLDDPVRAGLDRLWAQLLAAPTSPTFRALFLEQMRKAGGSGNRTRHTRMSARVYMFRVLADKRIAPRGSPKAGQGFSSARVIRLPARPPR